MTYATYASQYANTSITTAPAEKLLTMLFDRLLLDLQRGEKAFREGDTITGRAQLGHAQEILGELASSLNVEVWEGGRDLLSLYTFILTETISASNNNDADKTAKVTELVTPLAEAFKQAADVVLAQKASEAATAGVEGGVLGVG